MSSRLAALAVAVRLPLRLALAALCIAGVAVCVTIYFSNVDLRTAFDRFVGRHDYHRALRDLRASDSSLNPSVLREIGIAYGLMATGRPASAERAMAAATRRQPGDVRAWAALTRIQLTRGRLRPARASWVHVRRLDPHFPRELPATLDFHPRKG